ncbi:MAG: DUF1573 domain-containing protein [Bacteroidales bacterium]|nr:DUF1573 domain-containing protein [Bacteroidales bacterium]
MIKYFNIYILICCIFCVACNINQNYINIIKEWSNKTIELPNLNFTKFGLDTIDYESNKELKILFYIDSTGCTNCKMRLIDWNSFLHFIDDYTNNRCAKLFIINPKNKKNEILEIRSNLRLANFEHPVIIDYKNKIYNLNNFPSEEYFHCFLLDSNNRVILIGNPVQNPKIKDLYIRTICERLEIDTTNINNVETQKNRFSFGRFPFSETMKTQFVLRNDSLPELIIDTIFTSCECTTAKIDKSLISRNDSAIISVSFKTDKPEEFTRDVYVKTNLSEKPIVYTVEGMAY